MPAVQLGAPGSGTSMRGCGPSSSTITPMAPFPVLDLSDSLDPGSVPFQIVRRVADSCATFLALRNETVLVEEISGEAHLL